jgi:hypothetical protein
LIGIYKQTSALNVELNPEITAVMDRLIATEEEIKEARAEINLTALFKDPIAAGMSEAKAILYKEAIEEAELYAEAKLNKALLEELNRKQSKQYKEKYDLYYHEAKKELMVKPVYQALDALKRKDPVVIKIDRQSIIDKMGKEIADLLPRNIFASDGLDYAVVAEMFGFESGESFVVEMVEAPDINEVSRQMANDRIKIEFPELFKEPEIKGEAMMALHNEKQALKLRYELEFLEEKYKPLLKDATRRIVARSPIDMDVRSQAAKIIAQIKVEDIKPYVYMRSERKYSREAGEKLAAGDIKGAFEAKRMEYLNHELYRAAVEAEADVEKTVKNFKKIFKKTEEVAKTRDADLVNAARAILQQFGIVKGNNEDPFVYLTKVKEYDPQTYESVKPIIDDAVAGAGPYGEVSYDDFVEMRDAVTAIWELAKSVREIEIDGKTMQIEDIVTELAAQTDKHLGGKVPAAIKQDLSKSEERKIHLLSAKASMRRVESWTDLMDLGVAGPFKKYIWNPISEAITQYRLQKDLVLKQYKAITTEYKDIFKSGRILAPELITQTGPFVFKTKGHLLMAILHSGNESNKSKLLRGRGWGTVDENGVLDSSTFDSMIERMQKDGTLTKSDYEFCQKIWDLMESLKPGAQKAHKKMYGYYFNEITADKVVTPWGEFRGGYIPAKVNTLLSEDAAIRQEKNEMEENNNSFQFPTTGRGFTKKRVDSYAAELTLEIDLLGSHIDGVLRFTHVEPHVKQVGRAVQHKAFRNKLYELDPVIAREMLAPWLKRAAQQKVVFPSTDGVMKATDKVASYLRTSAAMQFMVGNVTNALQQLTGVIVAATKVQPRHLSLAMFNYITSRNKTLESIYEKSAWMKANQENNIYETQAAIEKVITDPSTFESMQEFAKKHTYFLQSATQGVVNTIVWQAAYNQAVEKGESEIESVRAADSAVRLTQGTVNAEDISAFETGTATRRLFTQFAGYFNMLANLNGTEMAKIQKTIGLKKGAGKAFYIYLMGFMIPAVLSELIMVVARGKGLDEDDDEQYIDDLLALFFGSQTRTALAMLPGLGQAINATIAGFNDKSFDDRLNLSPVISLLDTAANVPAKIYKGASKEEIKKQVVKDTLMTLGVFTALPIGPVGKPLGYYMDVKDGKAEPSGPVDFTRGLVTGQSGD